MSKLNLFSQTFHDIIKLEKTWLEYRGKNNCYYPSDPRWKGISYWEEHNNNRTEFNNKKTLLWTKLTDLEQYILDPCVEETGYDWFRNEYELKILLRKAGGLLNYGWPDPLCHLIGHLCSSEEGSVRFVCMNCWKMYDRDPTNDGLIIGGPDEKWIAEVIDRYAKTRGTSKPATT